MCRCSAAAYEGAIMAAAARLLARDAFKRVAAAYRVSAAATATATPPQPPHLPSRRFVPAAAAGTSASGAGQAHGRGGWEQSEEASRSGGEERAAGQLQLVSDSVRLGMRGSGLPGPGGTKASSSRFPLGPGAILDGSGERPAAHLPKSEFGVAAEEARSGRSRAPRLPVCIDVRALLPPAHRDDRHAGPSADTLAAAAMSHGQAGPSHQHLAGADGDDWDVFGVSDGALDAGAHVDQRGGSVPAAGSGAVAASNTAAAKAVQAGSQQASGNMPTFDVDDLLQWAAKGMA